MDSFNIRESGVKNRWTVNDRLTHDFEQMVLNLLILTLFFCEIDVFGVALLNISL
ncbi:hypothetical protein OKW24_002704 [Peribacillus simplex]|nr:hypothetical protein [Peribacillus simplex]